MPLPLPETDVRLLRFSFILNGIVSPCDPTTGAGQKLTGEPSEAEGFYFRDQLSGPLVFSGDDYTLLSNIENSADRCLSIGLLLEARTYIGAPWATAWQGIFTCSEQGSKWDRDRCTFTVTPVADDAYRVLLENWDTEINLLDIPDFGPTRRQQVTAELVTLTQGTFVEFLRVDAGEVDDYLGVDGWTTFLTNTSYIDGGGFGGSTSEHSALLFRYRLVAIPRFLTGGTYSNVDKSDSGWQALAGSEAAGGTTGQTVDYVKAPTIAGFRPYEIKDYKDWYSDDGLTSGFFGRQPKYGDQLLLLPCFESPADYGFVNSQYLKVTGAGGSGGGPSLGGAQNDDTAPCLNVRRNVDTTNAKSLWWRFGSFKFGRCFPLPNAIRFALERLSAPLVAGVIQPADPALAALVPPTNAYLSTFYTAPTNPATGDTGADNEIPRLVLSAASDVKRYGASEAATRLMISPKTLITDACIEHDLLHFIDPVTGYFRMEHRTYAETRYGTGPVLDLTALPSASLPAAYTTRQQQLPRYEELTIANANTVTTARLAGMFAPLYDVDFASGLIDYGASGCTNSREGQNRSTRSVTRLSGDVAAMVLNGDAIPDNALAILAPDINGRLSDANQVLAASRLLQRYHLRGRAALSGTINGLPVVFASLKPQREQADCTVHLCEASGLTPTARLTTTLGTEGRLAKRELVFKTQVLTLTVWLPIPFTDTPAVLPTGRQFDDSHDRSFW